MQAQQRLMFGRYESAMASLLAEETGAAALDLPAGGLAAYAVAGHTGHITASTRPRRLK